MAISATSSVSTSGALVTRMPRALAAARSTWSTPTLMQAMILSLGSASISSALIAPPKVVRACALSFTPARNALRSLASNKRCTV